MRVKNQIPQNYCTPVLFTRFFCAFFSFHAIKFPAKYETWEPGKIIMERISYDTAIGATSPISTTFLLKTKCKSYFQVIVSMYCLVILTYKKPFNTYHSPFSMVRFLALYPTNSVTTIFLLMEVTPFWGITHIPNFSHT